MPKGNNGLKIGKQWICGVFGWQAGSSATGISKHFCEMWSY
jgi:hypothetical protein